MNSTFIHVLFQPPNLTNDLSRTPPSTSLYSGTSDTASVTLVSGSGSTLSDYSSLRYFSLFQGLLAFLPVIVLEHPMLTIIKPQWFGVSLFQTDSRSDPEEKSSNFSSLPYPEKCCYFPATDQCPDFINRTS